MSIIRKVINTPKAPKAIGPYSQAVQVNHMLHVSGQLGLDPDTMKFVSDDDVRLQTEQVLTNMKHIVEAAGSSMSNIVETTILLSDMNNYAAVNEVYQKHFQPPYPARAAYEVATLPKNGLVEIKAMAIIGQVSDAKL